MDTIVWLFNTLRDVPGLVQALGENHAVAYPVLFAIIFAETGLLVGFFLPGDSLLFSAGLACAPGNQLLPHNPFNLYSLNLLLIAAAIIGDTVGYWIGNKIGAPLYQREKTFLFRKDHLLATKDFYERHGGKTIILARFVPFIRTFAPVVAGIALMPYRRFIAYNVLGGIGWVIGLSTCGYFLGQRKLIRDHLDHTILLIIFVSVLPAAITFIQSWLNAKSKTARGISSGDS